MINAPITIEKARKYRYHPWAGNPKGWTYREDYCAYEVWGERVTAWQCNGLYCKQHASGTRLSRGKPLPL